MSGRGEWFEKRHGLGESHESSGQSRSLTVVGKSSSVRLLFFLFSFIFSGLFQHSVLAAPLDGFSATNTSFAKHFFLPTNQQCDEQLQLQGQFGPDKSIVYSRPASPLLWAANLNRIPITPAYGDWVNPNNQAGPLGSNLANLEDAMDAEPQIWAPLSSAYARATTGTAYLCLNPRQVPGPSSSWLLNELLILRQKGLTIFQVNAQDTTTEPVQIWPAPAQ